MAESTQGDPRAASMEPTRSLIYMRDRALSTCDVTASSPDLVSDVDVIPVLKRERSRTAECDALASNGKADSDSMYDSPISTPRMRPVEPSGEVPVERPEEGAVSTGSMKELTSFFSADGCADTLAREQEEGNIEYKRKLDPSPGTCSQ